MKIYVFLTFCGSAAIVAPSEKAAWGLLSEDDWKHKHWVLDRVIDPTKAQVIVYHVE
jgi:hypothetical protein